MQSKMGKKARRVLAVFLAFAMVMMNFSSIPVKAEEGSKTTDVLNVSELESKEYTETTTAGKFTIIHAEGVAEGKGVIVEDNSKSIDGFAFTKRLKLNGTGSTSKRSISYTATEKSTMIVYAMSGSNSADRNLILADANGTVGTQVALGSGLSKLTYTIPAAGTYYLFSENSGINVYYVSVTPVPAGDTEGGDDTNVETPTAWDFTSDDYTGQESYNGLTIVGGVKHSNASYGMRIANGSITVPVKGSCDVYVSVGYNWDISFDNGTVSYKDNTNSGDKEVSYSYTGEAGTVTINVGNEFSTYIKSIRLEEKSNSSETPDSENPGSETPNPEAPTPDLTIPESVAGKIDVWDFAAEKLDESVYTNKLSVDVINSWYGGSAEAGARQVALPAGTHRAGELFLEMGGKTNNRIRTNNTVITRHDEKSLKIGDVTYNGYFYSNSEGSKDVYVGITAKAGDILTFVVSSNEGNSTINFVNVEKPDKVLASEVFEKSKGADIISFYAPEDGTYKVYSADEKLIVARVYRESTNAVTVSGTVTAPAELSNYGIAFTNQKNGVVTTAEVNNGTYNVTLNDQYTYDVSLVDANGYIISSAASVEVAKGSTTVDFPITIIEVSIVTVAGVITGLTAEELEKATISFETDEIYKPEITFDGMNYSVNVEKGMTYNVVVKGINDYTLKSPTTVSVTEEATIDLIFEKKPVYAINIVPTGATIADLAEATFTFTNLNEEGYVYTFTGTDNIQLRDGVYSVNVENSGIFVQKLTSNLKVEGASVTKTIGFDSDISEWVFSDAAFKSGAYANSGPHTYNGLSFSDGCNNKDYLLANSGTITVPVKGDCTITVNACYQYSFYFVDNTEESVDIKTGSTGQIDTFGYNYKGGEGTVTITVLGQSYITSIKLEESVAYKETVTVGASGCDYTTINGALSAVRAMARENNERVTIEIQPGNYEEMLVVDVPNVTLKNASATPSIETKNKGVDIDVNAVRITGYYGHGYTYYSMNNAGLYDEEVLAVNKENGYASYENPGAGSKGYWNATVTISASGFEAKGIIFENSFNQYVSEKAANDVIVAQSGAKEGTVKRADMKAGDITVQNKAYVERAAALALANNVKKASFDNCKFIGRQDTLYGGTGTTAAFYDCAIYGGTDYIFGGMTAVFAKCDLVFNTSEDGNDVGYITAAQTPANTRGLLLYNCTVTSTVPGVDTASEYPSKAGYFGRPWATDTGEAVFYYTIIEAADEHWYEKSPSLIMPEGWNSSLKGESVMSAEYGTYEMAKDVDNQSKRVSWASTLTEPVLADNTNISIGAFLGDWDAFAGKDMTIEMPDGKVDNKPEEKPVEPSVTTEFILDATADLTAFAQGIKADGDSEKAGTEDYFTLLYSAKTKVDGSKKTFEDGYVATQRVNFGGKMTKTQNAIKFTTSNPATVKVWWVCGGNDRKMAILGSTGDAAVVESKETAVKDSLYVSELELTEAGTYYLGGLTGNNYIFKVHVTETPAAEPVVSTLDATSDLKALTQGAKADGDSEKAGTENYFTILYSAKTKIDGSSKTFEDGYSATQRINFGDKMSTTKNAIKFTTSNAATVKIWWVSGGDGRQMAILDGAGTEVTKTEVTSTKNALYISELELTEAGTYYLGGLTGSNYIFKVEVTETPGGAVEVPRADWSTVAAPVIKEVALDAEDANVINVTVSANVGHDGADKVTVVMTDAEGKEIATRNSSAEKEEHVLVFEPENSGTYTFAAKIMREDEDDKNAAETKAFDFVLPLVAPHIKGAYNAGAGKVDIEWDAVKEAVKYVVSVDGTDISVETTGLEATLEGLDIGETYIIKVVAVRGNDTATASVSKAVKDEVEIKWYFSAYGSSTNKTDNGYELLQDGSIRVFSKNGKGKIVPDSTDGLAFYYTLIDPETTNFTMTATAIVNEWTYSNGQEGFGIMAADRVGTHGDSTAFWNNAYMAIASKVEYYYDDETNEVTDNANYSKISMKLGIGSQEKVGVTAENLADFEGANSTDAIKEYFKKSTTTLETSCGRNGTGTYNLIGNSTNSVNGTIQNPITEVTFTIQKNNTGYFVSYTDAEGKTTTQKYYDADALSQIEEDSVAIGFFASRNADVTFKDITFTTIAPEADAPVEERPIKQITPVANVLSGTVANSADYELVYYTNFDGTVTINGAAGVIVNNAAVEANEKYTVNVPLNFGNNNFTVVATPDADYVPGEYQELSSYAAISFTHTVNYKAYGEAGDTLYVAPNASASGNGTESNPLDIYTAVKYAQPGQTIILKEGTYKLRSTVKVERGIDGTKENPINMIADPEAKTRPVLDFQGICAGMVLAGDYWCYQGFDVTNSANGQKGIQVSGNYNVLDQLHTYKNGNTGIQISRYLGTDEYADWPAYNLILNCTSWENADAGYEDADGFAAKLTVGDGNVFDGCVAHHNADDGWDLYAKVQSGSIGAVTIRNSVAYKNGYVFDENGKEIEAGNGNGFKMGGESMPGAHVLENSIAFYNKAKGIDSNSGPDIKVYNSIAFNNESYNVALYTNTAGNTNYEASGIISYRTGGLDVEESFKFKGSQEQSKVYGTTNYYWDVAKQASVNSAGEKVSADWFKSLEFTEITRNEDGTINMNGFLELTENAKVDASIGGNGSAEITPGETTDGTVSGADKPSSGSQGSGSSGSGSYDDDDDDDNDNDNIITDIIDTIVEAITGGNKDKDKDKVKEEKVSVDADELVKDLVADIVAGESVGTAVDEETAAKIVEAVKAGKTIVTEVVTKVLEEAEVPVEEKDAIIALVIGMTDKECGIAQYLDLSVLIGTSDGETLGNYHETSQKVEFTVEIPSEMIVEGRTFFVVRVHNGEVDVIDSKDNGDGTITFKANKFSTYAIAYIDGEVEELPVVKDETPVVDQNEVDDAIVRENSGAGIAAVIAVLLLAIGSFIIMQKKKALK